jgi:hypothetical protein
MSHCSERGDNRAEDVGINVRWVSARQGSHRISKRKISGFQKVDK